MKRKILLGILLVCVIIGNWGRWNFLGIAAVIILAAALVVEFARGK